MLHRDVEQTVKHVAKKALILFSCIALLLICVSDYAQHARAADSQVVNTPQLAVFYKPGKITYTLRMGMLKKDVDKLIGKPQAYKMPTGGTYYKYGELYVGYLQDRLSMILPDDRSYLKGGVKLQMPVEDALSKLGEASLPNSGEYYFRWDGKQNTTFFLKGETAVGKYKGRSDVYVLRLSGNAFGNVSSIEISRNDYRGSLEPDAGDEAVGDFESVANKPLTMSDLAFVGEGGKPVISLGMKREQVEKRLGKPTDDNLFSEIYEGLGVHYRNDKVVSITISLDEDFKTIYRTTRRIGLTASMQNLQAVYGLPTTSTHNDNVLTYIYYKEEKNNTLRFIKSLDFDFLELDFSSVYFLSVNVEEAEDGQQFVNYIMISDYQYAMNNS